MTHAAAECNPQLFIAGLDGRVVIDEAQLVPALALAIKKSVEADRQPGRSLLTGSTVVPLVPRLSSSLAGCLKIHMLRLFSQGEIAGVREGLIDELWAKTNMVYLCGRALMRARLLIRAIHGHWQVRILIAVVGVEKGPLFDTSGWPDRCRHLQTLCGLGTGTRIT